MLNIDVEIERIDNGYIVTGNDGTKNKTYYKSLVDFYQIQFDEEMKELDKYFREHNASGEKLAFQASIQDKK